MQTICLQAQTSRFDQAIFEKTGKSTSIDFDASEFAKEIYSIKIQSEKSTITRKIIKQ